MAVVGRLKDLLLAHALGSWAFFGRRRHLDALEQLATKFGFLAVRPAGAVVSAAVTARSLCDISVGIFLKELDNLLSHEKLSHFPKPIL